MPEATIVDFPALRRDILATKDALLDLIGHVREIDPNAASALERARSSVFEAWTILCGPPEEDDDH